MGWGGPLSFGRFTSVQHNQNTGHLLFFAHVARTAQPLVAVLFVLVPPKETFANRIGYLSQAACS